jgi:tRNA pseudouridine55 synthase
VRALALSRGERLVTGACLDALRRTRSGDLDETAAIELDAIRRDPALAQQRLIPVDGLLQTWPAVRMDAATRNQVSHGRDVSAPPALAGPSAWVRLLDEDGRLVALATWTEAAGTLHPAVVLV